MEEKLFDHGLDHPFFMTVLFLFLLTISVTPTAQATTFGTIPFVGQVERAPYVIQGIVSGRTVEMDPRSQHPYTYWRFHLEEQIQGPQSLGSDFTIRSPGGEVGNIGYQVPGRADFKDGERVVIMAKNSSQEGVLEVYGLASGKYSIEDKGDGKTELRNGLGATLTNAEGAPISLESLKDIVARVHDGRSTEADKAIILNGSMHEHSHKASGNVHAIATDAKKDRSPTSVIAGSTENNNHFPPGNGNNSISERQPASDRSLTGPSEDTWLKLVAIGIVVTAFFMVAVFFVRKPKE